MWTSHPQIPLTSDPALKCWYRTSVAKMRWRKSFFVPMVSATKTSLFFVLSVTNNLTVIVAGVAPTQSVAQATKPVKVGGELYGGTAIVGNGASVCGCPFVTPLHWAFYCVHEDEINRLLAVYWTALLSERSQSFNLFVERRIALEDRLRHPGRSCSCFFESWMVATMASFSLASYLLISRRRIRRLFNMIFRTRFSESRFSL